MREKYFTDYITKPQEENFSLLKDIDFLIKIPKSVINPAVDYKIDLLLEPEVPKTKEAIFLRLLSELVASPYKDDEFKYQLNIITKRSGYENIKTALNSTQENNKLKPLKDAIQKQNFSAVQVFLDSGVTLGPEEKAIFEVARDSKAAKEYGLPQIDPKLDTLHPVKKFGLVLGIIMTSADGTFSQSAHMSPTYQMMTDFVGDFAKANSDKKYFQEIAEAFDFSNHASAFRFSTSTRNPEAGHDLFRRIQTGKLTTIPVSCAGHVMGLSYVPDSAGSCSGYLVYTNRGLGTEGANCGTDIFRIDDSSKITPHFINNMLNGLSNGTDHDDILSQIKAVVDNRPPIYHISQSNQKRGNCTIANPRSNIEGILLCQKAIELGGVDRLTSSDFALVKKEYKEFTRAMRLEKINELARAIKENPRDMDLENLAKEYLKQHAHADPELKEPLMRALPPAMIALIQEEQDANMNIINIKKKIIKNEILMKQNDVALHAVMNLAPNPTEGYAARLVDSIKSLADRIVDTLYLVARSIGISA